MGWKASKSIKVNNHAFNLLIQITP
jgi:hypothetical protein